MNISKFLNYSKKFKLTTFLNFTILKLILNISYILIGMVETLGLLAGLVHHCGTCSGRMESLNDGNTATKANAE